MNTNLTIESKNNNETMILQCIRTQTAMELLLVTMKKTVRSRLYINQNMSRYSCTMKFKLQTIVGILQERRHHSREDS